MKKPIAKTWDDLTQVEKDNLQAEHKAKYMDWLRFIIKDKTDLLGAFKGKEKQTRILKNEIKHYQNELNGLIGFTPEPTPFDSMSFELRNFYDKLYKKQCVLIACKKDETYCDKIKMELRQIELEITKQERLEGKTKELEEIPF